MRCPVDNETLVMTDRNGVEIDYCPRCRGVWLDRGELDKIIERAAAPVAPAAAAAAAPVAIPGAAPVWSAEPRGAEPSRAEPPRAEPPRRSGDSHRRDDDDDDDRRSPKRRKESFLSDLFDF